MFINPEIKIINKDAEKTSFFCNTCGFPLVSHDDFANHTKHECCSECYLTFVQSRIKEWKEGWRPEQTVLEEYIYKRKLIRSSRRKK